LGKFNGKAVTADGNDAELYFWYILIASIHICSDRNKRSVHVCVDNASG
jgi:hypothetical protein